MKIRSVSFDTSFLLKKNVLVDKVIHLLSEDFISCFITSTVLSELEQLKIWGRISGKRYNKAMGRWKHAHATIIDFHNRLLSDTFGQQCMESMKKNHGVRPNDIVNDCSILVSSLKNGIDLFLSEDFHFTSKITRTVINEISHKACKDYHLMCHSHFFSIDTATFLDAYQQGDIDISIVETHLKKFRKK